MNRKIRRIFIFMFIIVCAAVYAKPSYAKIKQVPECKFTTLTRTAELKAVSVKEGDTNIRLGSRSFGYIRFKAKETRKYTFTVSGLSGRKADAYVNGLFYIMTKYGDKNQLIGQQSVKTKGGYSKPLRIANRNDGKPYSVNSYLKKRSGIIKLKKGQVVYIYLYANRGYATMLLNIK